MSHAATKWAFDQPEAHRDMKPSEWAVLMVLADCHNPVNGCFPSQDYICAKTNLGERAVRDQLTRLRERGLIDWDAARENGRRGSNRYRLGFECDFQPANSAGSTGEVSTGEIEQVQPAESDSFNRQNLPPNPVREPVREPVEREREREIDPKKIDADGWALLKDWPGFAGMPKEPALKMWRQLSTQDRADAARLFPHWLALLKAQRKSHVPAPSTYFGQRLWAEVPEPVEVKPTTVDARPFGPVWQVARLKQLLAGPTMTPAGLTSFERSMVADGKADEGDLLRQKLAKSGYPIVNHIHDRAANRQGIPVAVTLEPYAALMVPLPVGCDAYESWRALHEAKGWPWLPDPGDQRVVYFPAGGPEALDAFEAAIRGNQNDAGGREAAE
jgi:hypothetical protein